MFRKLLILFIILGVAAASASWLANQPGAVKIEWLGWRMELPTSLAVAIVISFALVLVFLDRLLRAIRGLPRWLGGRLRQRRDDSGHRALTLGLMAVSAGEPAEARKYASRAERLLKAPQLTGLLAAQAAHLAGDHQAACRYFTSLLDDRETAFLGHIGLMRLAIDDQNSAKASNAARAALEIRPASVLAASHLLRLEAHRANWQGALPALDVISKGQKKLKTKAGDLTQPDTLLRQRCALNFLQAGNFLDKDRSAAIKALLESLKTNPGFLPALIMLADIYLDEKAYAKATKILESGFRLAPHSLIVTRLKQACKSNDGHFISRLGKLLVKVDVRQKGFAYLLVAEQAQAAGMDGEVERLLNESKALNEANNDDNQPLWQCNDCKGLQEEWQAFCPACGEFASFVWQRPVGVTPLMHIN
ncbi:hypothetical protein N8500_00025 [Candidatus Puniceispirillum sp.]|nr:hypothetical protein [Candidatus Puniceispirillum sp.]